MLRLSLGSVAIFALLVGGLLAADDKKDNKDNTPNKANPATTADHNNTTATNGEKAKVVNVNPREGTIILEMKDKDGKETKRTFHLTEDVRVIDESTGRVAALDVFRSGDEVLAVEAQGKLRELHRNPHQSTQPKSNKEDKSKENNKQKK